MKQVFKKSVRVLAQARSQFLPAAALVALCVSPFPAYCANPDLAPPELQAGAEVAGVFQFGASNTANINQAGADKAAQISQIGTSNAATIAQSGLSDQAIAVQYGSGNSSNIVQTGNNDRAATGQYGAGNQSSVYQTASDVNARVNEIGVGNKVIVLQTHPGAAPAVVNAIGIGTTQLFIQ